jgi:hypothetical protein
MMGVKYMLTGDSNIDSETVKTIEKRSLAQAYMLVM